MLKPVDLIIISKEMLTDRNFNDKQYGHPTQEATFALQIFGIKHEIAGATNMRTNWDTGQQWVRDMHTVYTYQGQYFVTRGVPEYEL